jgi:hypothetical protein
MRKGGPERLDPRRWILAFDMDHDCPLFIFDLHVAPAALSCLDVYGHPIIAVGA